MTQKNHQSLTEDKSINNTITENENLNVRKVQIDPDYIPSNNLSPREQDDNQVSTNKLSKEIGNTKILKT